MYDFTSEHDRIEHNLTLHPPTKQSVADVMDELRDGAKVLSHLVDRLVPSSREKSIALTDLESVLAAAIGGVARHQDKYPDDAPTS